MWCPLSPLVHNTNWWWWGIWDILLHCSKYYSILFEINRKDQISIILSFFSISYFSSYLFSFSFFHSRSFSLTCSSPNTFLMFASCLRLCLALPPPPAISAPPSHSHYIWDTSCRPRATPGVKVGDKWWGWAAGSKLFGLSLCRTTPLSWIGAVYRIGVW